MSLGVKKFIRIYLLLTLFSTFAASFIWGINTLFLLDAGLSNAQAFGANAFFTAGMVLFEVPTGVIADTWGRRTSYILGTITLLISTLLYLYLWQIQGAFVLWAAVSMLLGLGFTFFSGATQAWLVDGLKFNNYSGDIDPVFAKGQIVTGIAMLSGSVAGGFIAQISNLGVPYILRSAVLLITFFIAFKYMHDEGFTPRKSARVDKEIKEIVQASVDNGFKVMPVRSIMLANIFTTGVGFFGFYALQPYLLELWGDKAAYGIAGLAAAIVACAQIAGGAVATLIRRFAKLRTSVLIGTLIVNSIALALIGWTDSFWVALIGLVLWALAYAASEPVRQAYLNGLIESKQRATVLSFDSLLGSSGGVVIQPALGRVADVYNYGTSYIVSAGITALSLPFAYAAKKAKAKSDLIQK